MRLTFQWLTLAATIAFTAVYWLTTIDYPAESIVFPRIVMVAMVLGAAAAVFRHNDRVPLSGLIEWGQHSRSARLLVLLLAYVPLYHFAGFVVSSVSFLVASLLIFGVRGLAVPAVAVTSVALLYAIFSVALNIVL